MSNKSFEIWDKKVTAENRRFEKFRQTHNYDEFETGISGHEQRLKKIQRKYRP